MFALWGVIAVAMGAGDYYNVFNALTQMPKGARTYLYQMNSYWYILKINKNKFQKINLFYFTFFCNSFSYNNEKKYFLSGCAYIDFMHCYLKKIGLY